MSLILHYIRIPYAVFGTLTTLAYSAGFKAFVREISSSNVMVAVFYYLYTTFFFPFAVYCPLRVVKRLKGISFRLILQLWQQTCGAGSAMICSIVIRILSRGNGKLAVVCSIVVGMQMWSSGCLQFRFLLSRPRHLLRKGCYETLSRMLC